MRRHGVDAASDRVRDGRVRLRRDRRVRLPREAVPELDGVYLFADYCSGLLWGLGRDGSGEWVLSAPIETGLNISSFGEDAAGELYVTDRNGGLYRVTGGA